MGKGKGLTYSDVLKFLGSFVHYSTAKSFIEGESKLFDPKIWNQSGDVQKTLNDTICRTNNPRFPAGFDTNLKENIIKIVEFVFKNKDFSEAVEKAVKIKSIKEIQTKMDKKGIPFDDLLSFTNGVLIYFGCHPIEDAAEKQKENYRKYIESDNYQKFKTNIHDNYINDKDDKFFEKFYEKLPLSVRFDSSKDLRIVLWNYDINECRREIIRLWNKIDSDNDAKHLLIYVDNNSLQINYGNDIKKYIVDKVIDNSVSNFDEEFADLKKSLYDCKLLLIIDSYGENIKQFLDGVANSGSNAYYSGVDIVVLANRDIKSEIKGFEPNKISEIENEHFNSVIAGYNKKIEDRLKRCMKNYSLLWMFLKSQEEELKDVNDLWDIIYDVLVDRSYKGLGAYKNFYLEYLLPLISLYGVATTSEATIQFKISEIKDYLKQIIPNIDLNCDLEDIDISKVKQGVSDEQGFYNDYIKNYISILFKKEGNSRAKSVSYTAPEDEITCICAAKGLFMLCENKNDDFSDKLKLLLSKLKGHETRHNAYRVLDYFNLFLMKNEEIYDDKDALDYCYILANEYDARGEKEMQCFMAEKALSLLYKQSSKEWTKISTMAYMIIKSSKYYFESEELSDEVKDNYKKSKGNAIKQLDQAIEEMGKDDKYKTSIELAKAYGNKGAYKLSEGKLDEALYNHNKSLEIKKKLEDSLERNLGLFRSYVCLGTDYFKNGENQTAIENYDKALELEGIEQKYQAMSRKAGCLLETIESAGELSEKEKILKDVFELWSNDIQFMEEHQGYINKDEIRQIYKDKLLYIIDDQKCSYVNIVKSCLKNNCDIVQIARKIETAYNEKHLKNEETVEEFLRSLKKGRII